MRQGWDPQNDHKYHLISFGTLMLLRYNTKQTPHSESDFKRDIVGFNNLIFSLKPKENVEAWSIVDLFLGLTITSTTRCR
jgi:hypothetical protein